MAHCLAVLGLLAATAAMIWLHPVAAQDEHCPLNLTGISNQFAFVKRETNHSLWCRAAEAELNLAVAEQIRSTQTFRFPNATAAACIRELEIKVSNQGFNDLRSRCNIDAAMITAGSSGRCANITTVADFKNVSRGSSIDDNCRPPLDQVAACSFCISATVSSFSGGGGADGTELCLDYAKIYAAGIVNSQGPTNRATVSCLFYPVGPGHGKRQPWKILVVVLAAVLVSSLLVGALLWWCYLKRRRRRKERLERDALERSRTLHKSMLEECLVQFTMEEISAATDGFHRSMLIGRGSFGNVYKGVLSVDGVDTMVAVKRFKNCSPAGDADFIHEVKMIGSVRHKNLVRLFGWCIGAGGPGGGHQRMIVYEYMSNGNLHDHLFGDAKGSMDWPARKRIALEVARGLAYLHHGAKPAIIHRDIKGGNILLDPNFQAKVADFGLARFVEEGMTHLTTVVAGSMGYIAPEYVMYQRLTDKNDVYSYGIVFLELLSGRRALFSRAAGEPAVPIADWAWTVVKNGRMVDVVEPSMSKLDEEDERVVERFVLVALLCAHSQVAYRPSMVQVVKMLEDEAPLPALPDRPVSLVMAAEDMDRILSMSTQFTATTEDSAV